jgi:outer membrane protein assembly factor BamB
MLAAIAPSLVSMFAGANGQLIWQQQLPAGDRAAGFVVDGILYRSAPSDSLVTALRVADGAVLWQAGGCQDEDNSVGILSDVVYITCGSAATDMSQATTAGETLDALDARTGQVRWMAHAAHFLALLAPDLVFAETPRGLAALRAGSGGVLWEHPVDIVPDQQLVRHSFRFAVRAAHGLVAYSPDGTTVEALRAGDGALVWRSAIPRQDLQDTQDWSVIAITDTVVLVHGGHGGHGVLAFASSDGVLR